MIMKNSQVILVFSPAKHNRYCEYTEYFMSKNRLFCTSCYSTANIFLIFHSFFKVTVCTTYLQCSLQLFWLLCYFGPLRTDPGLRFLF